MRRTIRPDLEPLEAKALLSVASGLVASLTAVASRTLAGARVVETFTETNVSNHDITVVHGPGNEGFTVTRGGQAVWNPHAGPVAEFLASDVLKPHQSLTIGDSWDVRSNVANPATPGQEGPPLSGTFVISNGLDQGRATATVTIPRAWAGPARRTHLVLPGPPALATAPTHAMPAPAAGPVGSRLSPSSS